jgi:hypothetical protein
MKCQQFCYPLLTYLIAVEKELGSKQLGDLGRNDEFEGCYFLLLLD